ncbi:MAG: prolipoprotein diacylglyceryl transferase [Deltaproteobacteria bacterium RIFCSPHIGHO2_12_FULL_43_9]|nr:MAG: prolipoprotein diacylglyceryl transferase [Deltaproteobacteria bacterium RIFCSPHIGHO2_12_FULL_43_9]
MNLIPVIAFNIDPVLVHLGPVEIRYYGLMYVLGFIVAFLFLRKLSKEGFFKFSYPEISDLLFWLFVGLLIGARIFYVIFYNPTIYLQHPLSIFAIWEGGLSFHGGLAGVIFVAWIYSKKKNIPFLHLGDSMTLVAPFGLFFGRIGNFLNGELYGRITTLRWGTIFPNGGPYPRHPSQIYEALGEGLLLLAILWLAKTKVKHTGIISALFLICYGIIRFFIEFFRLPDVQLGFIIGQFSMGQILCFAMIIAGGIIFYYARKGRFGLIGN